jgi:hypothetical protein
VTYLFYGYLVTMFLLTTVNVDIKLALTKKFVNRTGTVCSLPPPSNRLSSRERAQLERL